MKRGPRLKVSSNRLVKPGIEPAIPGLQGKRFIQYTTTVPIIICICLCHTVLSVSCSLVVTCWERDYLLALLHVMFTSGFFHFPEQCRSVVVLDCIDS